MPFYKHDALVLRTGLEVPYCWYVLVSSRPKYSTEFFSVKYKRKKSLASLASEAFIVRSAHITAAWLPSALGSYLWSPR